MPHTATESTPAIRLYSARLSMFGAKVQIAAFEKSIPLDIVMVPFTQTEGYSPKHPEVVRINPKKQVPVLINGDLELFDSTQILEYLEDLQPEPALWPANIAARARARQMEHMSDEVYFPHIIRLMGLQHDLNDPQAVTAIAGAQDFYMRLEKLLAGREFMMESFSFADIALYMAMVFGERQGAPITQATPLLLAWRGRMSARPSVRNAVIPMANYLLSDGRPLPAFMAQMLQAG
jgi:glutathione S-transferase